MWSEGLLRSLAERQHGLVTRPQLRQAGVTDNDVGRRISDQRLDRVHPGVFYVDSTSATWRTEVLAAVMAAGPGALASHRTAAVLWEFDAISGRMIEVTVPFNEDPQPLGVILHRTRRTNPGTTVDAIPVTAPEKSLIDIAPFVPERTLQKAARSAIRQGLTTAEKLDEATGLYGGRGVAGTRKYRRVVAFVADDQSGSVAEIDLKHIVLEAPVPRPVQQLQIRLPDDSNAYPDFSWPDRMRIVEADGFDSHGTPEQLESDLRRQNQLMDLGWAIRRFTAQAIRDRPREVQDEIVHFINQPFRAD